VQGVTFTIAIAHEPASVAAFDQAGVDVSINPRAVTAEEIVRFAHDPRMQQVAMLDGNRYEVLDVTTRESSRYIGMAFRDMPVHGSLIGAIVRNGHAIFPHGDDVLEAGDRVIIFTEAANAPWVVEAL
jgi:trk system potassium uptake protein TrkA